MGNHPSLVFTSSSLVFWFEFGSIVLSSRTFIGCLPGVIMMRPLVAVGALVVLAVIAEAATTYKDDYKKDSYKKEDYYKEDSYKDDYKKDSYMKDDYYHESYGDHKYEKYGDKYDHDYKYEKHGDKYDHDYKHDGYGDYKTHVTYAKSYKHEPEYKE